MSEKYIIKLENVYKLIQGKVILNNLNLKIGEGEIHALIGPNGAGKTTTLRCILGLLKIDKGFCEVYNEEPYFFTSDNKKRIGAVLDEGGLFDELTGIDNILFMGGIHGIEKNTIKARFLKLSDLLDLPHDVTKKVGFYSKGMKQKLSIIRELIHDADLLILDEPFNGLDPSARIFLRNLLKKLNDDGKTILISSHDLFDIEQIADNLTMLKDGSNYIKGAVSDLNNDDTYIAILDDTKDCSELLNSIRGIEIIEYNNHHILFRYDKDIIKNPLQTFISNDINVVEFYKKKDGLEKLFINNNK